MRVARELDDPEAMVVTLIPDGGRPYISKVFNDGWMREHGYIADTDDGGGQTVREVLRDRKEPAPLLTVQSHDRIGRALELMREYGISQVPVVSSENERAFVGAVSERGLLMASAEHPGILDEEVTEILEPPLPELAADDPTEDAIRLLGGTGSALIVLDAGNPVGILTAVDLVEVLNR
jgi:cystathionine beta-synthase